MIFRDEFYLAIRIPDSSYPSSVASLENCPPRQGGILLFDPHITLVESYLSAPESTSTKEAGPILQLLSSDVRIHCTPGELYLGA